MDYDFLAAQTINEWAVERYGQYIWQTIKPIVRELLASIWFPSDRSYVICKMTLYGDNMEDLQAACDLAVQVCKTIPIKSQEDDSAA